MASNQVFAYCTAGSYLFSKVISVFRSTLDIVKYEKDVCGASFLDGSCVFFFSYGCVVFWGVDEEKRSLVLNTLKECTKEPLEDYHDEIFDFRQENESKVLDNIFVLSSSDVLEKISASYAVSQSVKLAYFETAIENLVAQTRYIPETLAKTGKIALSRKEIARQIGRLYLQKSVVNLSSTLMDTPDFFWDRGHYKPFYMQACHELDLQDRTEILNHRYAMLQEIYMLLSDHLQHQHGAFLEWIIIALISTEILLAIGKDFLHLI